MAGNLLNAARNDARKYVKSGGFEDNITLTTPDEVISIETTGFVTKHHINFDTDGTSINAKNAHICVDEKELTKLGYPVRDNSKEVNLLGHYVLVKDSSNEVKKYVIRENFPDETLGLIVCILGDFEDEN